MRYINDARFLSKDRITNVVKISQPRQNNVSFVRMLSPGNHSDVRLLGIKGLRALKNINTEERL